MSRDLPADPLAGMTMAWKERVRNVVTDYWPFADALTTCVRMTRTLRKAPAGEAIIGFAWLVGRIRYLENENRQLREELGCVRGGGVL